MLVIPLDDKSNISASHHHEHMFSLSLKYCFVAHDWFLPEQKWLRFYWSLAKIKKRETITFTSWNYTLLHRACVKFRALQHVLNETRSLSESQDSRTFPSSIALPLYPWAQHFAFCLVHPSFTKALLVHLKQNTIWGGEVVIRSKYNRGNGIIRQGIMTNVYKDLIG